ncbi:MAG TPA: fatty acyl-AMP ligase [Polyangiaceae bacterium]
MTDERRPPEASADFERNHLLARLFRWEHERPERIAFRYLARGEEEASRLSWAELAGKVRDTAAELQPLTEPGDRVLLLFEPGLDFIVAFLGCWAAGVVAVPVAPPKPREGFAKVLAIAADSTPALVLTTERRAADLRARAAEAGAIAELGVLTVDAPAASAKQFRTIALGPEKLAFLQYTSGSTGTPKGVAVTHGNVLANERMMVEAFAQHEDSVVVGWLPLYHDMGLVGNVLCPVYTGGQCVLMNPVDFIVRPARWLKAISRYRATTSGGPNFAFDLCVERVSPDELDGVDLRSWRVAFCGAEPVRARTLERFARAFARAGFDARAFTPCYGMAECTLFASGCDHHTAVEELWLEGAALEEHRVVPANPGASGARSFVGCGHAWPGQELLVVNPDTNEPARADEVGEIWISGDHVASGYFGDSERSRHGFGARLARDAARRYLRTGDLGFFRGGQLFITGRLTEMIIIRGRNYYAEDIERTSQSADAAFQGQARASAFAREIDGEETLVVVQEVRRDELAALTPERRAALEGRIRAAIGDEHGVQPREIVLVRPGGIPCTTSGKVRRGECRSLHEDRRLPYL